jgi:hypothetical protein
MTAIRRPVLKIVDRSATPSPEAQAATGRVKHDARGNAVWSAPVNLEDTADLVLQADASAAPQDDGDPYNCRPQRTRPMR